MSTGAVAITNLLYRYAEFMDAGDLESAAALFAHARIEIGAGELLAARGCSGCGGRA